MKPWLKYSLIFVSVAAAGAAVYLLTARGKSRLLPYIPSNAAYVVSADFKALSDIFGQNNLKDLDILKEGLSISKKEGGTLGKLLHGIVQKPMETGIRFTAPAFIFGEKISRGPAHALIMELADEDLFTEFVTKRRATGNSIVTEGDFRYIECETGLFLAWGNNIVVLSRQMTESQNYPLGILKRSSPGSEGNHFVKELLNEKGALTFLFKPDLLSTMDENVRLPGMKEIAAGVPKGLAYVGHTDFTNGSVNTTFRAVATDQKALEGLKVLKPAGQPGALMQAVTLGKEPIAVFSLAVDLKAWYNSIKPNLDTEAREKLEKDETFKSAMETFTGDILFCLSPLPEVPEYELPFEWQLVVGTKGRATALENRIREMDWTDEQGQLLLPMLRQPVEIMDNYVAVGRGKGARGQQKLNAVLNPYIKSAASGFVDITAMTDMVPAPIKNNLKPLTDARPSFIMGGDYQNMHMDLSFGNKNLNGLAQLLQITNKIYLNNKQPLPSGSSDTLRIQTLENSKY